MTAYCGCNNPVYTAHKNMGGTFYMAKFGILGGCEFERLLFSLSVFLILILEREEGRERNINVW